MERMTPHSPSYAQTKTTKRSRPTPEPIRLDPEVVVAYLRERGYFPSFERLPRLDYDMTNALEVMTAIGKSRNPRFVIDDDNRFAYEQAIRWLHADPTMQALDPTTGSIISGDLRKGLFVAGSTGSGKSWLLELMRAYALCWGLRISETGQGGGERPLYFGLFRCGDIVKKYREAGDITEVSRANYLGLQDLGQEPEEALYMGNRQNVIAGLIESRGDRTDCLTLLTSNLKMGGDPLRERYGDRVASRLMEMCNYLVLKGKDRRRL